MTTTTLDAAPRTAPATPAPPGTAADASPPSRDAGDAPLVVRDPGEVPCPLVPGVVVVLPGGFRMSSGPAPAPPTEVRPVPTPTVPADVSPADVARVRAPAAEIVRLVTEVLAGRRPPDGVAAVADPAVRRYLAAARFVPSARPSRGRADGGRAGVPGCGGAPAARRAPRVHVGLPRPDAAEVCATVTVAGRTRALTLRLHRTPDGRWLATAARLL